MKHLAIIILFLSLSGCQWLSPSIKTVYVPEGDIVMLRQDIKSVDIWAWPSPDSDPVPGNIPLHEGWT